MKHQNFTTLKTVLLALVLTITANQLFAQTANGIFFQAVARDNFSNPAKDRKIYVQTSVIQTTITGTKVLTEEHQATTDATGVFSISIGNGVRVGGTAANLASIDWSKGPFYLNLKVSITPIGSTSGWDYTKEWVDMGTTSFGAVPYSFYAANVAGFDTKLNVSDSSKMLSSYAKTTAINTLSTNVDAKLLTKLNLTDTINYTKKVYTDSAINKKLNIADSATGYVTPAKLAAKTFDTTSLSNRINVKANASDVTASLNTKLNISDSTNGYVTPTQLAAKTFDQTPITNAIATKLNIADSTSGYVTPTQLTAKTFDTISLSNRINLKANTTTLTSGLATKLNIADSTNGYVTPTQLAAKTFDTTSLSNRINSKANNSDLTSGLALKANSADVTTALNLKANTSDLTSGLALKANTANVTSALNLKANLLDMTNALALKASNSDLISGLNLKLDANLKGVANGVASLNASGIIPSSQLPQVTLSSTSVVASEADMIALNASVGSIAIRTDLNKNYVLSATPANTLSNWVELLTPAAPVQTVNGYTGAVNIVKSDIGLSDVENTSDISKPISNATQTALDSKANVSDVNAALATKISTADATTALNLKANATDVTSSLATKISTADATAALNLKLDANKVGAANGVASLNALGKVPTDQIPAISFSSVKVLASQAEMLGLSSAVVGSVVIRTDVNKNYVLAVANPAVLSNWIELLTPAPPVQTVNGHTGNVSITKTDLGLENVQNTSDADKSISTQTQFALDAKVDKVTGKALSTNDYTTAEKTKLAAIIGTNTGDQDLSSYATNANLASKANIASPIFSGTVTTLAINTGALSSTSITAPTYASTPKTLSYTGNTISWNPAQGLNAAITLTQNSALSFTSAPPVGSYGTVVLTQDATGGRTISLPSFSGITNKVLGSTSTTTVSLSAAANAKDILNFYYDGTICYWNIGQGYGAAATSGATNLATGVNGTLLVGNGGTGTTTLTGLVKGNGSSALTSAVAGTDYQAPITLTTTGSGAATLSGTTLNIPAVSSFTLPTASGSTLGGVKVGTNLSIDGSGVLSANINAGSISGTVAIANGGTGSSIQNFVDLTNTQTIAGSKTFSANLNVNGLSVGRGASNQSNNNAYGYAALGSNTTGNYNNAFGFQALTANNNGQQNSAFGEYVLPKNIGGNYNTAMGTMALRENTSGSGNTGFGQQVLFTNSTGSNNTALGNQADVTVDGLSNTTAIGYNAKVSTSNTIQLGNTSVTNVNTSGAMTAPIYASTPQTLTDAATISWVPSQGLNASVTLAGNRTLSFSTAPVSGAYGTLVVKQDATGGRTLTLPSVANKILGSSSTTTIGLSTTANAIDIINFYFDGTNYFWNVGQGYGSASTSSSTANLATGVTGTLSVANGGTGATTLTGYIKGSGTATMTASTTIPVTDLTGTLPIANGGTGSATQNFVDLTTNQTIGGVKTFNGTVVLPTTTTGVTQTAGNNTTAIATTAFVSSAVKVTTGLFSEEVNVTTQTGATASFTLTNTPLNGKVFMYVNGTRIKNGAYSVSGVTVTYTAANNNSYALVVGDRVQFDYAY